jgi:hypothetical protein
MNIANILIVAPRKENDPTIYTFQWAQKAAQLASNLGYNVKIIEGDNVTYQNVTDAIRTFKPRLFASFSHGCPSSLQGQYECMITKKFTFDELLAMYDSPDPEKNDIFRKMFKPLGENCKGMCSLDNDICSPLCSNNTNINELKNSIIFATACFSAKQLGKCAINYGANSYIGFKDILMFPVDDINSQDMFGEIQLEFYKALLLGKTVNESEQDMIKLEDIYIRKYKTVKYISLPILWNKINRRILGNKNATLY